MNGSEKACLPAGRRKVESSKLKTDRSHFYALSFALCALSFCLFSCIPVDQLPPSLVPVAPTPGGGPTTYPDPEPGYLTVNSTHFVIKGYSQTDLDALKQTVEDLYNKVGNDTGLYTFLSSGTYTLIEYQDQNEYQKKTHQANWSKAVTAGKGIYCYPDPQLVPELAHQMVHLILEAYWGDKVVGANMWLFEGLAMNEELNRMTDADKTAYSNSKITALKQKYMPFSQMTFFVPTSEEKRRTDAWYQQVESVVTYLLAQGSALAFGQMLSDLKSGTDIDQALSDAYPAKFRSMNDLEAAWKYTVQ
jgi:hypothetical protein